MKRLRALRRRRPWLTLTAATVLAATGLWAVSFAATLVGAYRADDNSIEDVLEPIESRLDPNEAEEQGVRLPAGRFVLPAEKAPATVWAVGDGADGGSAAKGVARLIARGGADRLLYLGDVYPLGRPADYSENYATTYGPLRDITYPTPGNHDAGDEFEGYRGYWRDVTGKETPSFYSTEVAGWEILSLNSEIDHRAGSEQLDWLRAQLAGARGSCRLAFWHRPLYDVGGVHSGDRRSKAFWDALRGRAAIVVNGHDHNMQRWQPIGGITELIAGSGGHGHDGDHPDDDSHVAFANDERYGALRLTLRPGRADYAFVTTGGRTLDSGSIPCRPRG